MKTAVVTGGTGLVGRELLKLLSSDPRYGSIRALVRRIPDYTPPPRVSWVLHDFGRPDPANFSGDELYCCLGTTIRQAGSQEKFREVDQDYVIDSARMACQQGCRRLALISAMGASAKSRVFYNRVKGETEAAVKNLPFEACHILRPSLLLGERAEKRTGEKIAQRLMPLFRFLIPANYRAIQASDVANAMINLMNNGQRGFHIHLSGSLKSR